MILCFKDFKDLSDFNDPKDLNGLNNTTANIRRFFETTIQFQEKSEKSNAFTSASPPDYLPLTSH